MEEHLRSRHLRPELYNDTVSWDEETVCFQLFTLTGKLVGFQKYRPSADKVPKNEERGRYYTYLTKPNLGFFGVQTLLWNNGPIFVTEGIFDICRFHNKGFSGLALFSNNPKHLVNTLSFIQRPLIAVCDGDRAGRMLGKFGTKSIECPEGLDAGDLTEQQLDKLLESMS